MGTENRKLDVVVAARFSRAEREQLAAAADTAGLTPSSLIRQVVLDQLEHDRPKTRTGPRSTSPRAAQRSMTPSSKNGGGR